MSIVHDDCRFNEGVVCGRTSDCLKCGWNPREANARSKKIRAGGLTENAFGYLRLKIKKEDANTNYETRSL